MSTYIVNVPKGGDICLSLPHGSVTLNHGDYVTSDMLAALYPMYFIKLPDPVVPVTEAAKVVTPTAPVTTQVTEAIVPKVTTDVKVDIPEVKAVPKVTTDVKVDIPKVENVKKPKKNFFQRG